MGEWDKAEASLSQAIEAKDVNIKVWTWLLILRVHLGDREGSRRLCATMLDRYAGSQDVGLLNEVASACVSLPGTLANPDKAPHLLQQWLEHHDHCDRREQEAAEDGSLPVSVTLTDNLPGTATATATSTANIAETDLTLTSTTISAREGTSFSGAVTSFTDTGSPAAAAAKPWQRDRCFRVRVCPSWRNFYPRHRASSAFGTANFRATGVGTGSALP
jgi:hypothetical protein